MQIYDVLVQDHNKVRSLLDQLLSLSDSGEEQRQRIINQIRDELIPHSRAEEAVFYNSMRAAGTDYPVTSHGFKEHMEAEALLRTLQAKDKTDMDWRTTATKLKEALEHHISEEENDMFEAAQKLFSAEEAEMMASAFKRMKPEIREEGLMGTTMDMIANLMPPRFSSSFMKNDARP